MIDFKDLPSRIAGGVVEVATTGDLPTDVAIGSIRYVDADNTIYSYNGAAWAPVSGASTVSIGEPVTGGTAGSVLYIDSAVKVAQDPTHLFWDATNHRLGLGTNSPSGVFDAQNGAVRILLTSSHTNIFNGSAGTASLFLQNSASNSYCLELLGATTGNIKIGVPDSFTPYTLILPSAQGAASTFLRDDGSGNLSWSTTFGSNQLKFDYSNSTPASGPSIQWTNGTFPADLGLYVNTGLHFQGDAGNPHFFVSTPTTDGTLGATEVRLGGNGAASYFVNKVGIGVTNPSAKLEVDGGDVLIYNNRLNLYYNDSTPGSGPAIKWTNGSDAATIGIYIQDGVTIQGDSNNTHFSVRQPTDSTTLGTEKVRFDAAASPGYSFINVGDLGIGTLSPVTKLDVNGGARISGTVDVGGGTGFTNLGANWLTVNRASSPNDGGFCISRDSNAAWFLLDRISSNTFQISSAYGDWLSVHLTSGNVGIGTNAPTAKLDINGNTFRLENSRTVTNSTDAGNQGDIAWDSNYIYVCVATNTWARSPLTTW